MATTKITRTNTAAATKWAFCTVDSTRDVVVSLHRSPETAESRLSAAKRRAPAGSMAHLMYCVREVAADSKIGDRLHR